MNPVQWYNLPTIGFVMRSHELGKWGEDVAAQFLQSKGFKILARNWCCEAGELDIIALDNDTIVIVEVRTRSSDAFGTPEESLTQQKRRHLEKSALAFLQEQDHLDVAWRIDVIAIDAFQHGTVDRISHYENALEGEQGF